MRVKIAGREFIAVVSGRISLKNTIQEHRVESGYIIADHIRPEPEELHIEIYANSEELAFLKQLRNNREVFSVEFEDERGVYDNVVIESLEAEREYENSYTVTLTLKRIQTAELKTELVTLEDVQLTDQVPGGTMAGTQDREVPDAPEKQENRSWLDSIFEWFGGIFGSGGG